MQDLKRPNPRPTAEASSTSNDDVLDCTLAALNEANLANAAHALGRLKAARDFDVRAIADAAKYLLDPSLRVRDGIILAVSEIRDEGRHSIPNFRAGGHVAPAVDVQPVCFADFLPTEGGDRLSLGAAE